MKKSKLTELVRLISIDTGIDDDTINKIIVSYKKHTKKNNIEIVKNTNKVFDIFYTINPTIKFGNTTQRKAIDRLYEKLGEEKVIKMAEYAVSISGMSYAPTITTPLELENKIAQLVVYWKRNNNKLVDISNI